MALDIETKAKTPYQSQLLQKAYKLLDQEIKLSKQTGHYTSLGFDPDYLMYYDSFDRKFSVAFRSQDLDESQVKFYYYYFFRTWTHQPGRMLKKVLQQLGILYNNIGKASPYKIEDNTKLSAAYSANCDLFNTRTSFLQTQYEPLREFINNSTHLTNTRCRITQPRGISW